MPTYTDLQRAQLRQVMGYSKFFASSNSIFENALDEIQTTVDDGSTFNNTIILLNQILGIDVQRLNNSTLGLATQVSGEVVFDSARNDAILKSIGRTYIKQLSIIFSMQPSQDYYGRASSTGDGNINSGPYMPNYKI